jgi:hypothetical protein
MTILVVCTHLFVAITCVAQLAEQSWIPFKVGWSVVCSVLPLGYAVTFLILCAMPIANTWPVASGGNMYSIKRGAPEALHTTLWWKFFGLVCSMVVYFAMMVLAEVALAQGLIVNSRLVRTSDPEAEGLSGVAAATIVFQLIVVLTLIGAVEVVARYVKNAFLTVGVEARASAGEH